MRLKTLSSIVLAFSIFGCAGVPPFPDVDFGTPIKEDKPLDQTDVYWVPYYDKRAPYYETLKQLVDKRAVCTSMDHYGEIKKWEEQMKAIAKKRCK